MNLQNFVCEVNDLLFVFGPGIGLIKMRIAGKKKAQPLGIMFLGHSSNPPEIDRAFFEELNPGKSAPAGITDQGKMLEQLAVQAIIRVPAGEVLLFTKCLQMRKTRKANIWC